MKPSRSWWCAIRPISIAWRCGLLANRSDAEDIAQDTFLRAWRCISSFDGKARLRTWLHWITVNGVRMHRRSARRKPTESLHALLQQFEDTGSLGTTDPERILCADDFIERKQFAPKAREAFEQLRESYRTVFALRELEGASTEEVAKTLGISPACVRQRLLRARRTLVAIRSRLPSKVAAVGPQRCHGFCFTGVEPRLRSPLRDSSSPRRLSGPDCS